MPTMTPPAPYTPAGRVVDDETEYQYYWSRGGVDIPIPRWLAEIMDVPFMVRLEIFFIGLCLGLVIAALAFVIGFFSAYG